MGIFVSKDMVVEKEIGGVKFKIRPLTGEAEDRLMDLAGEYKIVEGEEKFVTNSAKMRTEKIFFALSGEGCGWSVGEVISRENVGMLRKDVREGLCEEIDKLSEVEGKKNEKQA